MYKHGNSLHITLASAAPLLLIHFSLLLCADDKIKVAKNTDRQLRLVTNI